MFSYLEDYKKNPLSASPHLVMTCFDELLKTKGLALIRGDIIGNLSQDEGQTILNMTLDNYLIDHFFQKVRMFNHQPGDFNYENFTKDAIMNFNSQLRNITATKDPVKDIGTPGKNDWNVWKP